MATVQTAHNRVIDRILSVLGAAVDESAIDAAQRVMRMLNECRDQREQDSYEYLNMMERMGDCD